VPSSVVQACLRTLNKIDRGHEADHISLLAPLPPCYQRELVRAMTVTMIFARRLYTEEARRAARAWAELERHT
jgi:hypothetical protein